MSDEREVDLAQVRSRYELARMAGEHATDAGRGWDAATEAAVIRSWQDVAALVDEVARLRGAINR